MSRLCMRLCTNMNALSSFMTWLPWLFLWRVTVASNSWAETNEAGLTFVTRISPQEDRVLKCRNRFPEEILTFRILFLVAAFRRDNVIFRWSLKAVFYSSRRTFTFPKNYRVKDTAPVPVHLPKMPLWSFVSILKTPTGSLLPLSSVQVTSSSSTWPLVRPVTGHMLPSVQPPL